MSCSCNRSQRELIPELEAYFTAPPGPEARRAPYPADQEIGIPDLEWETPAVGSNREMEALQSAIRQGNRDPNKLTDIVFHARHPELRGRSLRREDRALAKEWVGIRDSLVRMALASPAAVSSGPVPATGVTPLRSIKFWIKAFIPRDIQSLTTTLTGGPYAGLTALQGPTAINDCFLTDQRGFSNDVAASYRLHSEFRIDVGANGAKFSQWHDCGETVEVDCESGDAECSDEAGNERMKFTPPAQLSLSGPIVVKLSGAAKNPCMTVAPDIDYEGTITVDLSARTLAFAGKVDAFPAFEAYATINDGEGVELFRRSPGSSPWKLAGWANRTVVAKLQDVARNGRFQKIA